MQVSVENTGNLERKLRIEVPAAQINTEINNRLQNLSRTTRVQGFRPGKAPLRVIRGRYGVQVRKEVVSELVGTSLSTAIDQEDLKPVAPPTINELADEAGKDLSFTATFEIYPEVNLKPPAELKVEKPVSSVTAADIDAMIELLRRQQRKLVPVERAAAEGDVVEIDFEAFVEGKSVAGGKTENYQLELGSRDFPEDFEAGLAGKTAGEAVVLNLGFPKDHVKEALRGKYVEYRVQVKVVNETVLPEMDAKFMAVFGVKDGNEAEFRDDLRRSMERELEMALKKQTKDRVLDRLHEINRVELPRALVATETRRMQQEWKDRLKEQGINPAPALDPDPALLRQQAERRVSLQLIAAEIIRQNDLQADPAEVRQMIERLAAGYDEPEAVVNWYYSNKETLARIEALVLEDAMIDWVLTNANVTEKVCTFDEITNKGQTDS